MGATSSTCPRPEGMKTMKNQPKVKVTKKMVCIELLDRKGGATLDEMAAEIKKRGIDKDLVVNRTTCSLWMSKIGFEVQRDKTSGKYSRKVAVRKAPKALKAAPQAPVAEPVIS